MSVLNSFVLIILTILTFFKCHRVECFVLVFSGIELFSNISKSSSKTLGKKENIAGHFVGHLEQATQCTLMTNNMRSLGQSDYSARID